MEQTNGRRQALKMTMATVAGAGVAACATGRAASDRPAFLLVHGAWHGAWTYQKVIPGLSAKGHAAVALDLPGHGLDAAFPASWFQRPLDPKAFGTEVSPVAGVTVEQCADTVITALEQLRSGGHTRVVLVGHSLGGVTITRVAERVPEKLAKVVYLSAFMLPAGQRALDANRYPESATAEVRPLVRADPVRVGATRIDFASPLPADRAAAKSAFYGDLSEAQFNAAAHLLTPDEPIGLSATPTEKTVERWGSVPRHYIMCLQDHAIPLPLQRRFIAEADTFTPSNRTVVHRMDTSHSPFLSSPDALAALLSNIAVS